MTAYAVVDMELKPQPLTPVQREILADLAAGLGVKQIAARRGCTRRTVVSHMTAARIRLAAETRDQAIALFVVRYGLPAGAT